MKNLKITLTIVLLSTIIYTSCGDGNNSDQSDSATPQAQALFANTAPSGIVTPPQVQQLVEDYEANQNAAVTSCMSGNYSDSRTMYFTMADFLAYANQVSMDLDIQPDNIANFGMCVTLGAKQNATTGKWENVAILVPVNSADTSYASSAPMLDFSHPYPGPPKNIF